MMNLEEMLGKVTDFISSEANTKSVVGEEIQMGEYTCVPVIKVGIGFGSGGGEKSTVGGGGGAGGAAVGTIGAEGGGVATVRIVGGGVTV